MKILSKLKNIFRKKEKLKIGDYVMWERDNTLLWAQSKPIVYILDGFAFFDGSMTGVPLKQLRK